mgnify:CR=1 FL=1
MFKNLGLHIIKFPSGRYGFVGSIPTTLGTEIMASTAAVMGGRAYRNAEGEIVELKFPSFDTEAKAQAFATSKQVPWRAQHRWVAAKLAFEPARQQGDPLNVGLVEARQAFLKPEGQS